MEEIRNKLWTAYDLEIPLIIEDFEIYLLREGIFNEEDYKKILQLKKILKDLVNYTYNKNKKVRNELIKLLDDAIGLLSSLQPKKPLPAEMKRRIEDLRRNLQEIKEIVSQINTAS
ncbi:MAG: hypothetical protein QXV69_06445 [Sulfolobaceae archaeon]